MLNNLYLSFYGCSSVSIQTDRARIICDPWFDTPAYEGTWIPKMNVLNWVKKIGDCDGIYVSHIHPDHYDSKSIFNYFKKYGPKKIFIPQFKDINNIDRNWLKKKMISDGIDPKLIISNKKNIHKLKDLNLIIVPRDFNSFSDIDSALIVYENNSKNSVTNLNDFGFNEIQMKKIQNLIVKNKLKNIITLYNYMSSGSWPQTHFTCNLKNSKLIKNLEIQRDEFKNRYFRTNKLIEANFHFPFAAGAQYLGPLSRYERFRPVTKIETIIKNDSKAIYLKPFKSKVDLIKLKNNKKYFLSLRPKKISENYGKNKHIFKSYDYENTFKNLDYNKKVLKGLFAAALSRALKRNEVRDEHILSIYALPDWKKFSNIAFKKDLKGRENYHIGDIEFNLNKSSKKNSINKTEIFLHYKALFGALSGVVHWNNLELGAHKLVRRTPEKFNRDIVNFLNFFSIS